jgi:hypothetical protein
MKFEAILTTALLLVVSEAAPVGYGYQKGLYRICSFPGPLSDKFAGAIGKGPNVGGVGPIGAVPVIGGIGPIAGGIRGGGPIIGGVGPIIGGAGPVVGGFGTGFGLLDHSWNQLQLLKNEDTRRYINIGVREAME